MKGNSALSTNGFGNNYVAGNLTIDGQGARKGIQFNGGAGNTFNVGGNFTVKNFTPYSFPGVGGTNVYLHNLNVAGTDTVGTFYCYTGDVNTCNFNGNFRLIADSTQPYGLYNSSFSGVNNLFRAGNLDINNNRFGQLGNGITTFDVSHNVGAPVVMRDGNNKFLHDVDWIAVSPSFGSILIQNTFYGVDSCLGNLTLDLSGPASANLAGNELYLGKGLILQNNGSGTIVHSNGASAIHFIGADTANYLFSGTGSQPSLINIEMKRRGGLRLMSPLTYSGTLAFTRGIILSSASNPLQVANGALVTASWDSGYVDGPVKKVGNTAFTFPLGGNNVYAPLSISAPSSTTDAFTAQYFNHIPHIDGYDTTQHDVSLNHLSRKEYWTLNRTAGSSNVNVILSWKSLRSGSVTNLSELRVARWNGTTWKDEGNGGTTGNTSEGTIQSLNTISSFSPFTLASTGPSNPLPVHFVSFDARLNVNRSVTVQWTTTNEINNDHFEIERSTDLVNWTKLLLMANGSSHSYTYIDVNPAEGYNYYRIKQVDVNGGYLYTEIRTVVVETVTDIILRPNPVINDLNLMLPFSKGVIEIASESGAVIMRTNINTTHIVIPVIQLKAGTYFARITSGEKVYVKKFVKI